MPVTKSDFEIRQEALEDALEGMVRSSRITEDSARTLKKQVVNVYHRFASGYGVDDSELRSGIEDLKDTRAFLAQMLQECQ